MTAQVASSGVALAERSSEYLTFVEDWLANRPPLALDALIASVGGPEQLAVVSVDLIVGFCHTGPLSSPRVASILPSVVSLLERVNAAGIRHVLLAQDTHRADAEEFGSYPPHCVAGTEESRTAPELSALPFSSSFTIAEKNSISSIIAPTYLEWEQEHGPFSAYIVVGDCTDLCVYQAAMALKIRSQAHHFGQRVIVPANCVETYDLPVRAAQAIGAQPHAGDLLHHVFLHSMAQNGVEVVAEIQ